MPDPERPIVTSEIILDDGRFAAEVGGVIYPAWITATQDGLPMWGVDPDTNTKVVIINPELN